jgi:hypothetical protein
MWRLALVAPALLAGCYTYSSVQPATLRPGMSVRVRVSPTAAERVAPLLGVSDARVLTGTLIDNTGTGGAMIVEVPTATQTVSGGTVQSLSQRISIAPGELMELESRKLDRTRTGIIVGAVVIIGGSSAIAALHSGPGLDRPPVGSTTDARIPLLRIHF